MYDIVGDVHGQAGLLKKLFWELGYTRRFGSYSHPTRKMIFLGDFINRGPQIRETVNIIRSMVEDGNALSILGNHELNAIIFNLKEKGGIRFYSRTSKLRLNLYQTLNEFARYPEEWKSHLKWMRTLPMFMEMDGFRVVHACWKDENIDLLKTHITEDKLKKSFLRRIDKNNSDISKAFWETCKGIDFQLPNDMLIFDSIGRPHRSFRSKWWIDPVGKSFRDLSFETRFDLPSYTIPAELVESRSAYPMDAPIVFFGHYCLKNGGNIISNNLCCLDSCISRNGKLAAYQWNGEKTLTTSQLVKVGF